VNPGEYLKNLHGIAGWALGLMRPTLDSCGSPLKFRQIYKTLPNRENVFVLALGCDLKQLDETEAARHPLLSELVELKLKLRDADEGSRSQLE